MLLATKRPVGTVQIRIKVVQALGSGQRKVESAMSKICIVTNVLIWRRRNHPTRGIRGSIRSRRPVWQPRRQRNMSVKGRVSRWRRRLRRAVLQRGCMSSDSTSRDLQCVQDSVYLLVCFWVHRGGLEAAVVDELRQLVDSGREQFGCGAEGDPGKISISQIESEDDSYFRLSSPCWYLHFFPFFWQFTQSGVAPSHWKTRNESVQHVRNSNRHTLILLSRHGTHAVVTCLRCVFLVCAGAGAVTG